MMKAEREGPRLSGATSTPRASQVRFSPSVCPFFFFFFLPNVIYNCQSFFPIVQPQQSKWSTLCMILRWLFPNKALILNNDTVLKQGFLLFFVVVVVLNLRFCSPLFTWLLHQRNVLKQHIQKKKRKKKSNDCLFHKVHITMMNPPYARHTVMYTHACTHAHTLHREESSIQDACKA